MAILQMMVVTILLAGCQAKSLVARQGGGNPHICPQHCTFVLEPVCGSDGVTYSNPCQLEAAACQQAALYSDQLSFKPLTMLYASPCGTQNRKRQFNPDTSHCHTHCNDHYAPVCGSNDRTYTNRCHLEMDACIFSAQHPESHHTITVAYDGECTTNEAGKRKRQFNPDTSHCHTHCNDHYAPVCGSNDRTYTNRCHLEMDACIFSAQHPESHHTITVAYDGECTTNEAGNRKRQFNPDTSHCHTHCNDHYAPVCGSNDRTYTNRCHLEMDACIFSAQHPESHHTITVAYDGECTTNEAGKRKRQFNPDTSHCHTHCNDHYAPVCGSNDRTYTNRCHLEMDACIFSAQHPESHHTITVAYDGECTTDEAGKRKRQFNPDTSHCHTHCNDHYAPVCGSNDRTYTNRCHLEMDACIFSAQHPESHHTITVAYDGECTTNEAGNRKRQIHPDTSHCHTHCSSHYDPVCSSNGHTYFNRCYLEVDACIFSAQHPESHHTITVAYDGECHHGGPNRKRQFNPDTSHCQTHCNEHYAPVCGSNGQTYANRCNLEIDACIFSAQHPESHHTITVAYDGECHHGGPNRKRQFNPDTSHCQTHCNEHYAPVCGSNGQTYANRCNLEIDACIFSAQHPESHHTITVAYDGECHHGGPNRKRQFNPDTSHCQTHCSGHYDPVCGSNGQTYTNRCHLDMDNCIFAAQHPESHHTITVAYDGECHNGAPNRKRQFDTDCPMFCPEYYSPVCGSNGHTYDNICFLESAACIFSAQHPNSHHTITVAYDGRCHNGAFLQDGAIHDGVIQDGAIHDGVITDAVIQDGAIHDGVITDAIIHDGAIHDGAIHDGVITDAVIHDGAIHDGVIHDRAI